MSKAINGDGLLVAEMRRTEELLKDGSEGVLSLLRQSEADLGRFRRNSDRDSPLILAGRLEAVKGLATDGVIDALIGRLREASEDHERQATNLEQTYFGQYRKALSDGSVRTGPLDPAKFARKLAEDMTPGWTTDDIVAYTKRGQETSPGFRELPREEQLRWLLGRSEASTAQPAAEATPSKAGRPASDGDIRAALWGDHLQAVSMSVRSDHGGRDREQKWMARLGIEDGQDGRGKAAAEAAARHLEAYRSRLQSAVSSRRPALAGGPSYAAAKAISEILDEMGRKPTPEDVAGFRASWPYHSRAADRLLDEMERMREGSLKRMSRRLEEMRRRCAAEVGASRS